MRKLFVICSAIGLSAASFAQIANAGFETGDFTGWTIDSQSSFMIITTANPHSGTHSCRFGATSADGDAMHQFISDTNGAQYTLSFWAFQTGGDATNSATHIQWNGVDLMNGIVGSSYTQYSFAVTGTGNDRLDVKGWNSPSYAYMDDFSLAPVPEPATFAVLGIGALALLRRRRAK